MSDEIAAIEAIECRTAVELSGLLNNEITFLPTGVHAITPEKGGIGRPIRVLVDPSSAEAIECQRQTLVSKGKRPYFDFNHEDGRSSFWPERFFWRDNEGVVCTGDWSGAGKKSVKDKDYRAFSPVFYVDNKRGDPARVIARETARPNMGGLVNDPAFNNLPLWAKNDGTPVAAGAASEPKHGETNMTEQEIAALRASKQELENRLAALEAKPDENAFDRAQVELDKADSELRAAQLQLKVDDYEKALETRKRDDAIAAVTKAVAQGKIAARNIQQRNWWIKMCTADPKAIAQLEALPSLMPQPLGPLAASHGLAVGSGGTIRITAEDPTAVYAKLGKLTHEGKSGDAKGKLNAAKDFAAIYASEISRFEGGHLVYQPNASRILAQSFREINDAGAIAAGDVTDANLGTLSGTLVVQRVLELLKFSFPALTSFTTDFSDQGAQYNQTIMSRTVTVPGLVTYSTSTGWADSTAATTDVPVTINNHKGVQITFNEQLMASTMRRLFDEFAPAQAYALGKGILDSVYANITDANFTNNTVVTQANFGRSSVVDVSTQLNLRGVPNMPGSRTMLLYSTYFGNLQKDATLMQLAAFQRPGLIEAPQPGPGAAYAIPVAGFAVYDAPNLPTNNANLNGFAGSRSALLIATRVPSDYAQALGGASYGQVQYVTDTDIGLTVMSVQYIDHKLATATSRLALMWGSAVGQGAAGQLIKSNTGSGSSH